MITSLIVWVACTVVFCCGIFITRPLDALVRRWFTRFGQITLAAAYGVALIGLAFLYKIFWFGPFIAVQLLAAFLFGVVFSVAYEILRADGQPLRKARVAVPVLALVDSTGSGSGSPTDGSWRGWWAVRFAHPIRRVQFRVATGMLLAVAVLMVTHHVLEATYVVGFGGYELVHLWWNERRLH